MFSPSHTSPAFSRGAGEKQGNSEWKTYPVAADGHVEDEEERPVGQGGPDALISDGRAAQLVELLVVHEPGDGLGTPVAVGEVPDDPPPLPILVGDADAATATDGFVAS